MLSEVTGRGRLQYTAQKSELQSEATCRAQSSKMVYVLTEHAVFPGGRGGFVHVCSSSSALSEPAHDFSCVPPCLQLSSEFLHKLRGERGLVLQERRGVAVKGKGLLNTLYLCPEQLASTCC